MSDRYANLLKFMAGQVWAIMPEKLALIREVVSLRVAGVRLTDQEIRQRLGLGYDEEPSRPKPSRQAGVAILPLYGFLCPKANMITEYSGGTSLEVFTRAFRMAMADQAVGSVVIDVDSPGGSVYGVEELWTEVFNARKAKPIKAVVNPQAGSAAYWIASAAEEVVVTPSGDLGSVGVYVMHEDLSKALEQEGIAVTFISAGQYKTEGQPFGPLTDEAKAYLQGQVDTCYQTFVRCDAKGRGVSTSEVLKNHGQGRMVLAREAVARGMADRVGTLEETVARLAGKKGRAQGRAALALPETPPWLEDHAEAPEATIDVPEVIAEAMREVPATPPEETPMPDTGFAGRERARAALDLLEQE